MRIIRVSKGRGNVEENTSSKIPSAITAILLALEPLAPSYMIEALQE